MSSSRITVVISQYEYNKAEAISMTKGTHIQIHFDLLKSKSCARGKREIQLGWKSSLISILDFLKGVSQESFCHIIELRRSEIK